jgi:hypothetical protein
MAWQRSPRVVYEVVDGEAVLVDPEGKELLTLNAVGTMVWEELDGRRGASELAAALVARFDGVTEPEIARDIEEFLADVEAAGLVCEADDAAS